MTDWISLKDQLPPENSGKFLVTNNMNGRNAGGGMSHVWTVGSVHLDDGEQAGQYCAYEGYLKLWGLTHWAAITPLEAGKDPA